VIGGFCSANAMKKPRTPMRLDRLPQQKCRLSTPMPGNKPYPSAEFYKAGSEGLAGWWHFPKAIKRRSVRLCALEWSWSAVTDRLEAYYLHPGRTHWML
jgi:hypothetical protein